MKKHKKIFVKKGIVFIILVSVILIFLNQIYISVVEKDKLIFRKDLEWQNYKSTLPNNTLDYAFFGDSHTKHGLNPKYINNSFNFGISGQDYVETYYLIKRLIEEENIKINNFILETDIHSFSDKLRNNERLFMELSYYSTFVPLKEISELKDETLLSIWIKSNIKLIGRDSEIISYILIQSKPKVIERGWIKYEENFSNENNKTKNAIKTHNRYFSNDKNILENRSLNYFIKILNLTKENNISVIFIKYPLSYEYDLELRKNNISKKNYYKSLFNKIDKTITNYKTLDYYDLFFEKSDYFGDAAHLNYKGAEILSKQVAKDLK